MINLKQKLALNNKQLEINEIAPDFSLTTIEDGFVKKVKLSDFENKIKIISTFPSIDTGVCDNQVKNFIDKFKDNNDLILINVSADLPFAFNRWCLNNNKKNVIMLSDYYDHSFAKSFGINIENVNLIYRSIFILDKNNKVLYKQLSEYLSSHLDYEQIYNFLNKIL